MPKHLLLASLAGLAAAGPVAAQVPNHLCPAQNVRGHAFDAQRALLYVATDGGLLRWDPGAQQFLTPWLPGRPLRGMDLTVDGNTLLVCELATESGLGKVHRIDLATGQALAITYPATEFADGSYDVVALGNGKALFTGGASGWGPLREIDLATNAVQVRAVPVASGFGEVREYSQCVRSADGATALFLEGNLSSGPAFVYDAATDTFPAQRNFQTFWNFALAAVSRDGSRAVVETAPGQQVVNRQLANVSFVANAVYGAVFHPLQDRLYAGLAAGSQIQVYDTTTWSALGSFPAGEALAVSVPQGAGEMSIAADGSYLGLTTPNGVRVYRVGLPRPIVESVAPAAAHWDAGAVAVTVRGRNFDTSPAAAVDVQFGGLPATNVQVVDAQTLTCSVPADGPGPKAVRVQFGGQPGQLDAGFVRTPALQLGGALVPGGAAELTLDVRRGDFLGAYFALPPAVPSIVSGVHGMLWLGTATPWFLLPSWPLPRFQLSTPIPAEPGLVGLQLVLQAMTAMPGAWTGAVFSNHVVFAVQ